MFFYDKNEYYLQVFSEECLYEHTKCFEIIIMNVPSKSKSSENEKMKHYYEKKKIYCGKYIVKKNKKKYGLL